MAWAGNERRKRARGLTDEQFEELVRRAADLAAKEVEGRFYQELGRALIRRALQVLGAVLVAALLLYFSQKTGLQLPTGLKP